jgi:hypothetical protein
MGPARAAVLLLALVGVVALAGCDLDGEERTDEDYVDSLQDVATAFGDGANDLSRQIEALDKLDLKSAGAVLGTFSDSVDELADELDDVDPPAQVEELHARLVEILETFGARAQQASLALKAGDLLGGLPALTGFAVQAAEVSGKVDSTITGIKEKLGVD